MVEKLAQLIQREYPGMAPNTAYERIQAATGVSLSSMQRIMSGRTGPSIDTLADLAYHLGATVAEIVETESPLGAPDPAVGRAHKIPSSLKRKY